MGLWVHVSQIGVGFPNPNKTLAVSQNVLRPFEVKPTGFKQGKINITELQTRGEDYLLFISDRFGAVFVARLYTVVYRYLAGPCMILCFDAWQSFYRVKMDLLEIYQKLGSEKMRQLESAYIHSVLKIFRSGACCSSSALGQAF
eukprot:Gb_22431 [translate_table: standard]